MSPAERDRIRALAAARAPREFEEQGIPEQIKDPVMTGRLAALLVYKKVCDSLAADERWTAA